MGTEGADFAGGGGLLGGDVLISEVLSGERRWWVEHGDALSVLKQLPDRCIDSMVTDPPSGIAFMNRDWDKNKGGRDRWIDWLSQIMSEAHRVLKPGAHAFVWALPRTSHWTGLALEAAHFIPIDVHHHTFGSGFPKSYNEAGDGLGTALKPAHEHWWLVKKPLEGTIAANVQEHGTGALNIDACRVEAAGRPHIQSGTKTASKQDGWGGIGQGSAYIGTTDQGRWPANFALTHSGSCRKVGTTEVKANPTWDTPNRETESTFTGETVSKVRHGDGETETVDVFECDPSCPVRLLDEQSGYLRNGGQNSTSQRGSTSVAHNGYTTGDPTQYAGDSGGASRFFHCFELTELDDLTPFAYFAKPSRAERDAGLDGFRVLSGGQATGRADGSAALKSPRTGAGRNGGARNVHPTVKSVALMRHLCRLVTPPRGVCLDLFTGSGTTGVACTLEGFRFIGAEMNNTDEEPFVDIARARIRHVAGGDYASEPIRATGTHGPRQGSLF